MVNCRDADMCPGGLCDESPCRRIPHAATHLQAIGDRQLSFPQEPAQAVLACVSTPQICFA
jgi:hypothetical protein